MANAGIAKATTEDMEVIREPGRYRLTKVSRVHWWRKEKAGEAPGRIKLGPNSVGWLRREIEAWIAARAAERGK